MLDPKKISYPRFLVCADGHVFRFSKIGFLKGVLILANYNLGQIEPIPLSTKPKTPYKTTIFDQTKTSHP